MTLLEDARSGLLAPRKSLPPVWFYDEDGSKLFEAITEQPEYYLTATERSILRAHAHRIVAHVGAPARVAELGAGSSSKTRTLLEALVERQGAVDFFPIDVSAEALRLSRASLERALPAVRVHPIEARNRAGVRALDWSGKAPWLVLFLGSSIGNLEPEDAEAWLAEVTAPMRPGDLLVLGVDREKGAGVLHDAYNDAMGVTAQFNLNLLRRLNRELGATFEASAFEHVAFYDPSRHRVEMHLRSLRDQDVDVPSVGRVHFARGETVHTENSYKYTEAMLKRLLAAAGVHERERYEDPRGWFNVLVLEKNATRACRHRPASRAAPRARACEGCGAEEQLRVCDSCGHVGCAESRLGHATAHARAEGHAVFRELTRADEESWAWCEKCGEYVEP